MRRRAFYFIIIYYNYYKDFFKNDLLYIELGLISPLQMTYSLDLYRLDY